MIAQHLTDAANAASVVIALVSAFECAAGRVGAMDWSRHRHAAMAGYGLASVLCMVAAVTPLDSMHGITIRLASACVAVHLLATWRDWRQHPPACMESHEQHALVPLAIDSRQDDQR